MLIFKDEQTATCGTKPALVSQRAFRNVTMKDGGNEPMRAASTRRYFDTQISPLHAPCVKPMIRTKHVKEGCLKSGSQSIRNMNGYRYQLAPAAHSGRVTSLRRPVTLIIKAVYHGFFLQRSLACVECQPMSTSILEQRQTHPRFLLNWQAYVSVRIQATTAITNAPPSMAPKAVICLSH